MRFNHLLAVLFAVLALVTLADLSLSLNSSSGTVIGKQDASSGFGKARSYKYQVSVQTEFGVKTISLAPATFEEVRAGDSIRFSKSAVFSRTSRIELNGKARDNTMTQAGTIVSVAFFASLLVVLGCLTLPGVSSSQSGRRT